MHASSNIVNDLVNLVKKAGPPGIGGSGSKIITSASKGGGPTSITKAAPSKPKTEETKPKVYYLKIYHCLEKDYEKIA